ncbi:MAG: acyl-CoA dehydrogenase family protein [Deltaproteobacteria bacterium]|nr:acyl-CoA dehydrogenase family protein [Deltaproteobacteria bacterium]
MAEIIPGGHFLVRPLGDRIVTPEGFSDEQREFMKTARDFVKKEIVPRAAAIEKKDLPLLRQLLAKAGELGFLSVDVPESCGGLGLDKTTSMILAEAMNGSGSWAVTFGAHVGIGTLPIVFFGNDAQRAKYLPKLASGEWVGAYALTEAGAGSDALGIRCKAELRGDRYLLNGTKQWITNAGMADVFTVFAKVDGSKFSAFVVERTDPGVSIGPEEHKLGLRGSSTCEVILEDAEIPADRLLGRVGRGHRIAFGILFLGRLKLGIAAIGGAKETLEVAIKYAKERRQFDRAIVEFGLIREKLARVASRLYACESMGYRTSGLIDAYVAEPPKKQRSHEEHVQSALEEYGIESAMLKVYGSEMLDFAVDEALQVFGGYGYTEHFDVERYYRDSRINRIFEGTNEINRLLVSGTLLRRVKKNELPLPALAQRVAAALDEPQRLPSYAAGEVLGGERQTVERLKWLAAHLATVAVANNKDELDQRQDLLGTLADLLIDAYAAESALLRTMQLVATHGADAVPVARAMTAVVVDECAAAAERQARLLAGCVLEGAALERTCGQIELLLRRPQPQLFGHLEAIAARLAEDEGYRIPA